MEEAMFGHTGAFSAQKPASMRANSGASHRAVFRQLKAELTVQMRKKGRRFHGWSPMANYVLQGCVLLQPESGKVYDISGAFAKPGSHMTLQVVLRFEQRNRQSVQFMCASAEDQQRVIQGINRNGSLVEVTEESVRPIRVLGEGTWGKVMLATLETNEGKALFALKEVALKPDTNLKHVFGERLVLGTIKPHPRVIQLLFASRKPGYLYYGLEFLPGGDLYTLLATRRRAFNEIDARFYAAEIASALMHLHRSDVVYRDLKPENVLLTHDGHVKLADFGMARRLRKSQRTSTFCGTDAYIPPEMHMGLLYSYSVDFWQFGCFLYELTRGKSPFSNRDRSQQRENIITAHYEPAKSRTDEYNNLIGSLLRVEMHMRVSSWDLVMRHPWFKDVNWEDAEEGRMTPPTPPLYARSKMMAFDATGQPTTNPKCDEPCVAVEQLKHAIHRVDTSSTVTDSESNSSWNPDHHTALLLGWTVADIALALRNFDASEADRPVHFARPRASALTAEDVFRDRLVGFEWVAPSVQPLLLDQCPIDKFVRDEPEARW